MSRAEKQAMRTAGIRAGLAAVVLAAGVGAESARAGRPGRKPTPATQPAAAAAPKPKAQPKTAPAQGDKDDEDEAVPAALMRAAKRSFVIVETWYKKDVTESPEVIERDWRMGHIYSSYIDQKRPSLSVGVVLDARGHVIVGDDGIEQRFIDRIVLRDVAGRTYPAERQKVLLKTPALVLKVSAADAGKLKPPAFVPLDDRGVNTKLLVAQMHQRDDEWRVHVGPITAGFRHRPGAAKNAYFGYRFSMRYSRYSHSEGNVQIVADEDGRPVGVSLTGAIDLRQEEGLWKGPDLIRAEGITIADLEKAKAAVRKRLSAAVQEVVLTLRPGSSGFADEDDFMMRTRYRSGAAAGREVTQYGVAISPTHILVPRSLARQAATQIEKISVKLSPKRRAEAEFVGAYKRFGAFVVKLSKGKLPAHLSVAERKSDLPRMKPFWVAQLEKRFGKKYVRLTTNRIVGKSRGYAGKYYWQAQGSVPSGAILTDLEGRLAGMYLQQRIEEEEARALAAGASRGYRSYDDESRNRIFLISEIRKPLGDPLAHLDPKIKVKAKKEAKRRAWLGVEFTPMNRSLAEQWKIEKPTKDGQLGFLINAVYASSPAEKMHLHVGDVLLRVKAPGVPYPIQLNARAAGREYDFGDRWAWRRMMSSSDEEGLGMLPPTWKARRNFLTAALDAIGVGKKIEITFYHREGGDEPKGKAGETTAAYTIQQAPRDFESAPKWKNRKLGLTVKDITYEVRYALNLQADAPGVVLAGVEPGSPTLVAKIYPFEIITRLDEKPIRSARHMRDMIAAVKKAGKKKVRLTILRLGKTRFADLAISEYDPAEDEGIDEE